MPAHYMRRRFPLASDVVFVLLFVGVIVIGFTRWLAHHDATTKLDLVAEANARAQTFITVNNAAWQKRYAALRDSAQHRDTVLVRRIKVIHDTLALVDTVEVPAAAPAVRACSALADDCETFRVSATTALVAADSLHQSDSSRISAMALDRVVASDSIKRAITERNRRPSWRTVLSTSTILAALSYVAGKVTP